MSLVAFVQSRFAALCLRVSVLLVVLCGLSLSALAATVTYVGSPSIQNFGTVNVGSSSSFQFSFNVSGTIGSVEVVTQGSPNLDFTNAGGGTCTSGTTSACTVEVTFKPIYPGLRRGAVLFWSGANNTGSIIGKTFIYGAGNGGQVVYLPPVISLLSAPFNLSPHSWNAPEAVAFDGADDLWVVDAVNNRLVDIPVTGTPSAVGPTVTGAGTLSDPLGAEVDGAGDLIISDNFNQRIVILPVGGGTPIQFIPNPSGGFSYPLGIAVDGLENLYVTDEFNYRVLKISNIETSHTVSVVGLGGKSLLWPSDVWLDAAGTLYISDFGQDPNTSTTPSPNPQILKVFADGTSQVLATPGCALQSPVSAEADPAGNVFIGDLTVTNTFAVTGGRVIEVPAGGGNCIVTTSYPTVDPSLGAGNGASGQGVGMVNLSAAGDVYVSDYSNNLIVKLQRSVAPSVAFTHSTPIGSVDTTDGTKTVQITNIGNTTLDFSGLSYPADFAAGSASGQCTASSTIAINGTCLVAIEFAPHNGGSLNEEVTLTNNANGGSQSITVTGTASGSPPSITSANSTTFTVGTAGSFTVTASGSPSPTFSETGALPSGVTLSSAGLLSGTPAANSGGTYIFSITASNGVSPNATQSFTLTVNQAPSITSGNNTSFSVGTAGSFTVTASGFPNPTFSETGTLPSGVTLSSSGVLSGTPAAGSGGGYTLTITASNGVSPNATQSFTLTVNQAPSITSANSTNFTVGTAGSFTVTASGTPSPTFSETGALPSGVTLSSAGLLSGTPAGNSGGTYTFTITASNGVSPNATQLFTLTVNQAPSITSANSANFTAGIAGSFTVTASAYPSATFSETGTLPTGLAFSSAGVLTGTPTGTSGAYPISITASNGVGVNATQSFTIIVNPGPATHLGVGSSSSAFVGSPISVTLTAYDVYGNIATSYGGTVVFTSTDPNVSLPGSSTVTNGIDTFNAYFGTVGSQTITATDAGNSFTATSGNISVTIPALVVTTATDDAGSAQNCTIQPTPGTGTDASCSLRDALLEAASIGSGSISFDSTTFAAAQSITLSNGTLTIPSNTIINGPTSGTGAGLANLVTVSGGGPGSGFPVFTENFGSTGAIMNNLIITNGNGVNGGAIFSDGGLTLNDCTISGNTANADGGAIDNDDGTLTVNNSTISGNSTAYNGGAIAAYGTVIVTNSTIADNSAPFTGGAIFNYGIITISDSTIAGNSAVQNSGGAILSYGSVTVTNSVLSGNTAASLGAGIFNIGGTVNANYSLFYNNLNNGTSEDDCNSCSSNTNEITTNPNLAPLGSYGGPTQTMLPLPASGAICAASSALIPSGVISDQRGLSNTNITYPGYSAGTPCVDAGAVQTNYALGFSTEPPATAVSNVPMSPAPVVQLTESGAAATAAGGSLPISGGPVTLTGTTSAGFASGLATFSNLITPTPSSSETLTATLVLNSPLALTASSSAISVANGVAATLTGPTGSSLSSSTSTFTWTPSTGATGYVLSVGTTGVASYNLYYSGLVTTTVANVNQLPTNGETIYVRLFTDFNGQWMHQDYTFTTAAEAALTSPTPSTTLTSPSVTFTWSPATGATGYLLSIGSTGAGSYDVYYSGQLTGTTTTFNQLPTNGETLYARLFTNYNGTWVHVDYTFTATTQTGITSPTPSTTLTNTTTTFTWATAVGATKYVLTIGSTGPGSYDLYYSGQQTATSATAKNLPNNGETIYVRLLTEYNGTWIHTDYTYTAP